jgi:hypothetical protein
MRRQVFSFVCVVLCLPVLQGAGCTAHYGPRLYGKVIADDAAHAGKRIVIVFRKHEANTKTCTTDWAPCMSEGWRPLNRCDAEKGVGETPSVTVGRASDFDACTGYIGVNYRADVAAFVDLDDNGRLDAGEPYGLYRDNPLWRDKEATALPLEITIDRVMP